MISPGGGPSRRAWPTVLAVVLGLHLPTRAEDTPQSLCGDVGTLTPGVVVTIDRPPTGGRGVAITACGVIDSEPATVWPVIRDCEHYRHFLPGVKQSALNARDGRTAWCESLIELPFPFGSLRGVERVTETELPGGRFERRWTLDKGNYRRLLGSWTLFPWGGSRTLAVYQLDMDPEVAIPDFILRSTQPATARGVFDAIRTRVRATSRSGR